jgi:hypothetical protein
MLTKLQRSLSWQLWEKHSHAKASDELIRYPAAVRSCTRVQSLYPGPSGFQREYHFNAGKLPAISTLENYTFLTWECAV